MIKENSRLQNQTTHWKIGKNKNQMILHNNNKAYIPQNLYKWKYNISNKCKSIYKWETWKLSSNKDY